MNEFTPHKFNNISTLKVYITNFHLLIIRVNIVNLYNYWFPLYNYKVRYKYVYELEERKTLGNIESKYRIWISAQCYNRTVDIKQYLSALTENVQQLLTTQVVNGYEIVSGVAFNGL